MRTIAAQSKINTITVPVDIQGITFRVPSPYQMYTLCQYQPEIRVTLTCLMLFTTPDPVKEIIIYH